MENKNELAPKEREFLISPEEAIKLGRFVCMDTMYYAANLEEMFLIANVGENETHWKHLCLLTTMFEAGRIQGIREQRKAIKANAV